MREWVVFADRSANNLGACCPNRGWSESVARSRLSLVLHLRGLFKKDFSEDVLFFLVRVVIFHIVVVRLVKNTG